jgi:hypothetical protein
MVRPIHDHSAECELIMMIGTRKTITIKIIIVDDEEIILEKASETLTNEGVDLLDRSRRVK